MKVCTKCKAKRESEDFGKDSRCQDGLKSRCRKCSNKDAEESKKARYHSDPVFREKRISKKSATRAKDKVRQYKNHETWKLANRARVNFLAARRYQRQLQATPKWLTKKNLSEMRELYLMARELSWLSDGGLNVDHIIPLQGKDACGLHVPWNLRIVPTSENAKKGKKLIV